MSNEFQVTEQSPQPALEITAEVKMMKVPQTLAHNWGQIKTHMNNVRLSQVGKPYARYHNINWTELTTSGPLKQLAQLFFSQQKLTCGIRTESPAQSIPDIVATDFHPARCISAKHFGDYHSLPATYKKIVAWAAEQSLTLANETIEVYLNAPGEVPKEQVETMIFVPLKS